MLDKLDRNIFIIPKKHATAWKILLLVFKKMEREEDLKSIKKLLNGSVELLFYSKEQTKISKFFNNTHELNSNFSMTIHRKSNGRISERVDIEYHEKIIITNRMELKDILGDYYIDNNQDLPIFNFKAHSYINIEKDLPENKIRKRRQNLVNNIKQFEIVTIPKNHHKFIMGISFGNLNNSNMKTSIPSFCKSKFLRLLKTPILPSRESIEKLIYLLKFMMETNVELTPKFIQPFSVKLEDPRNLSYSKNLPTNEKIVETLSPLQHDKIIKINCFGKRILEEVGMSIDKLIYIKHPGLLLFGKYLEEFKLFDSWEADIQKTILFSQRSC